MVDAKTYEKLLEIQELLRTSIRCTEFNHPLHAKACKDAIQTIEIILS